MDTDLLPTVSTPQHRHGDAGAFGALVRDHAGMVFATAKRVTGDAALAEDVAQETFLELARHGHAAVESVAAWLHRVAWRKACNAVRGEVRRRQREETAAEALHVTEDAPWKELEPLIDEALEELPAPLREALVEHFLEGRSQQEMASARGLSQSAISRQLDAGLHELRSRLKVKGVLCGMGLAALLGTRAAGAAAPASLHASLGKLAMSGAAGSTSIPPSTALTALLAMNLSKMILVTGAAAVLFGVPLAFLHQGGATPQPAKPAPALKPAPQVRPVVKTKERSAEPRRHWAEPVSDAVRLKVDAVVRRHRGMSKDELMRDEEFQQLIAAFGASLKLDSPEMKRRMEEAIENIRAAKGIEEEHGNLQMDFGDWDSPEFRAWAEAAISGDTKRAQDWVLDRLEGAVFEFALDPHAERTTDGVSVQPATSGKPVGDGKGDEKGEKRGL